MKKVFGMIHLTNRDVNIALREIEIYQKAGFSGVIIEDHYTSNFTDIINTLTECSKENFTLGLGVNILRNYDGKKGYDLSVDLTKDFGLDFIQVDVVAGRYSQGDFSNFKRKDNVTLYGGVWPKYYDYLGNFEKDLQLAISKTNVL